MRECAARRARLDGNAKPVGQGGDYPIGRKVSKGLESPIDVDGTMKGFLKLHVFLRDRKTGNYYAGPNGWSANSSEAHEFETMESASQLSRAQQFEDAEVVLHYEDWVPDLVLPLGQAGVMATSATDSDDAIERSGSLSPRQFGGCSGCSTSQAGLSLAASLLEQDRR